MPKTSHLQTQLENYLKKLNNLNKNRDIWIGLNDKIMENKFVWLGDGMDLSSWNNWGKGSSRDQHQPNNYKNQDCVALWVSNSMTWKDDSCHLRHAYVCERGIYLYVTKRVVKNCPSCMFDVH